MENEIINLIQYYSKQRQDYQKKFIALDVAAPTFNYKQLAIGTSIVMIDFFLESLYKLKTKIENDTIRTH